MDLLINWVNYNLILFIVSPGRPKCKPTKTEWKRFSKTVSIPKTNNFDPNIVLKCWGWLIIWTVVYVILAVALLEFIDKDKR